MKVALICSLFFDNPNNFFIGNYYETANIMFRSAKKHFLPTEDVDLIAITNVDHPIGLDFVNVIRKDAAIHNIYHALTMKVLCIEYLEKEYDYIFIVDADSIFVNTVSRDDVLDADFIFLEHFFKPSYFNTLAEMTKFISCDFNMHENTWTMGNFFGGKGDIMIDFFNKSKVVHDNHFQKDIMPEYQYYCKYAEEMFIGKYAYEEPINYKKLSVKFDPMQPSNEDCFLSDFINSESYYPNIVGPRLLHDTKKNMALLAEVIKYYE
jgi:hypothetical protein